MTQIVVVNPDATKEQIQKKLAANIEGAANEDGTWKKGWEPTLQSFIRKEGVGNYVVVHNLNNLNYALSVSLLSQPGSFKVSDQNDVSFRLETFLDRQPKDFAFRFSICVIGD